jgi:tetratricopeptide (TPR) repeat protein
MPARRCAEAQGRVAEAEQEYDEAIRRNGDYFAHYLNRGLVRQQQGNRAGAQGDLEQANKLLPTAAAHYVLGNLAQEHEQSGQGHRALPACRRFRFRGRAACRFRPGSPRPAAQSGGLRAGRTGGGQGRQPRAAHHQPQPGGIAQAARGGAWRPDSRANTRLPGC